MNVVKFKDTIINVKTIRSARFRSFPDIEIIFTVGEPLYLKGKKQELLDFLEILYAEMEAAK